MVHCLRESFMYTEKRVRDLFFSAIEGLVAEGSKAGSPYILSKLTREAADLARGDGQRAGIQLSNWDMASKAVINAMLGAGVLLTDGKRTVTPGVAARAARIVALKDGHRDLTETYLLEFLIRKLGDVRINDHVALAHALFRQFDPSIPVGDLEDRVVILLATLADRITLRRDGLYAPLDGEMVSPESSLNAANA
jgi:hypothetical protein